MNSNKMLRYPALFFSVDTRPVEVELPIPMTSDEGWQLYATLKAARHLAFLAEQVMPLLKAASLLEYNEHVDALDKILKDIPVEAKRAQEQFYLRRTSAQHLIHDPKGLRTKPQKSLFTL